ncbi:dehydrogenase [Caldanaerobacter subterraneus subsp. yonseiensis KB-1]|uniref:Dehydrogenase n=1 Tax=Caldanaerobacter subterraneus subsp. yonseiensis KB-1 TaxID=1388761 RepID=U5CS56_CALSX|nr:Gfo/Idh/MocA family oxidoreductase [Caldanaerobacter subterraneus]ERM92619.1 dehydrogenase [Caldanaerobacter subterraneus subsp. yonseiensis KB-1]
MQRLKSIIIGPGNIFNKAYLPFIFTLEELDIVGIVGRSEEKLKKYEEKYKCNIFTDLEEAIKLKPDCAFVHTATVSHYEIVRMLLENGVNVYVDKPITNEIDKTKELIDLARKKSLIFTIGFNRRYAPLYQKAFEFFESVKPELCLMEKHRDNDIRDDLKYTLYDDFIHIADTLYYIVKEVGELDIHVLKENNALKSIMVTLKSKNSTAIGLMHRNTGEDYEKLEIHGNNRSAVVEDMELLRTMEKGRVEIHTFGSWDSTSYKKGFVNIVKSFIRNVLDDNKKLANEELDYALKAHEIVEEIYKKAL